jgi:hypothetical protein
MEEALAEPHYETKIKNSRYLVEASINYWCV